VDPIFDILLKAGGSLGGLLVAVYALRQSWADKAEAVTKFTALITQLNQERKELQEKSTEAMTTAAVNYAELKGTLESLVRQHRPHGE
jgi:hypothetical protein